MPDELVRIRLPRRGIELASCVVPLSTDALQPRGELSGPHRPPTAPELLPASALSIEVLRRIGSCSGSISSTSSSSSSSSSSLGIPSP